MQRLQDALSLYKVFNEADAVDQWINEKMKLLLSMQDTDDPESLRSRWHASRHSTLS
jgi:spectrin beta